MATSLSHLNKACLSKGMASFTQDKTRPVRCLENSTARQQNTGRPLQCAFGSSDSGQGVGNCFLEVDLLCHCVVGCRAYETSASLFFSLFPVRNTPLGSEHRKFSFHAFWWCVAERLFKYCRTASCLSVAAEASSSKEAVATCVMGDPFKSLFSLPCSLRSSSRSWRRAVLTGSACSLTRPTVWRHRTGSAARQWRSTACVYWSHATFLLSCHLFSSLCCGVCVGGLFRAWSFASSTWCSVPVDSGWWFLNPDNT